MGADRLSPCGCCGCPVNLLWSYRQPIPPFGSGTLLWEIIEPGLDFHDALAVNSLSVDGDSLPLRDNNAATLTPTNSIVAFWSTTNGDGLALYPRPLPESSSGSTSVLRLYIGKLWTYTPAPNPFNPTPVPITEVRGFVLQDLPVLDSDAEPASVSIGDEFVIGDILFFADNEGTGLRLRITYKVTSLQSVPNPSPPPPNVQRIGMAEMKVEVFGAPGGTHTFQHTVRPAINSAQGGLISVSIENRADDNVSIWIQEIGANEQGLGDDLRTRDYCVWADAIPAASRAGNRWGMMQAAGLDYMTDFAIVSAEIRTANATAITEASLDSTIALREIYCDPCNLAAHPFFLPSEHRRRVKLTVSNMPTIDYVNGADSRLSYSFPTDLNGEYIIELNPVSHPNVPCGLNSIHGAIGPWIEYFEGTPSYQYWRPQPFHRFWQVGLSNPNDPTEWLDVVERQLFPTQTFPSPSAGTYSWNRGPLLWESIGTGGALGYDAVNGWWFTGTGIGGPVDSGAGYQGTLPTSYVFIKVEMII